MLRLNADGAAQEERYRYTVNEQLAESRINGILSQHGYHNECVTQAGNSRYEYDACGRVIKRTEQKRGFRPQEWRYRWDDFDRLREVRTPDGDVWQYCYDAFGRRTAKRSVMRAAWKNQQHTVSEVHYLWQGMALSGSEKRYADGSPALREQWHYRGGFELLAKEARAANDDTSYFYPVLCGPDGAPEEMYSANGRKVWTRQRSLWGLAAANDSLPDGRESCDAGFMGQWRDEESGLWYNLHRYYDAGTGQYLSQDPLKLGGGLNTQSYVHDPVGWCDPWGLLSTSVAPAGQKVNMTVYRVEQPDRLSTTWKAHEWNIAANHRYTKPGQGGVYGGSSEETALAEINHYGVDLSTRVIVNKNVELNNVLDLTNPQVRQQIGVKLEDITGDSYKITHDVGDWAVSKGYDGILAPSARDVNGLNLISFEGY